MTAPATRATSSRDRSASVAPPGVLERFDAWVRAAPEAEAVADDVSSCSYAELDAESAGYAVALRRCGAGPESVVAIVAERSPRYVAMVLGVLRAGAAFMPVEASLPARRARQMCRSASARHVLVQAGLEAPAAELADEPEPGLAPAIVPVAPLPGPVTGTSGTPARTMSTERDPAGLAYVIFTSGSTGVPKGAMVTDGGMANHIAAKTRDLGLGPGDVVGFTAPLSFDISVWQALTPLTAGGLLAVASPENLAEPAALASWVRRHGVTVLEIVPSFLAVVLDQLEHDAGLRASLGALRFLIATGEPLPAGLARRWLRSGPGGILMNAYGPTECSDDVTHHVVTEAECAARPWPSIGREILNTRLHVVDDDGRERAPGEEGELLVGGLAVGRGYIGDPVRTALAFVPDYLSGPPGSRLYRTGDRCVRTTDGSIDFLGRRDRQVKVRGHRVELGDVEAELLRVPGVAAAACVLADGRLLAYVTLQGTTLGVGQDDRLLAEMRASAPGYLVPHEVTVVDRMPTTASGKVDHKALLALRDLPSAPKADGDDSELAAVCAAFAEILGMSPVAVDDDFFGLGGDSLQAMSLVALARKRFGAEGASLRAFLADPSPRGLLSVLEMARVVPRADTEPRPGALSSGQERLWFLEQLHPRKEPLLIRLALTLSGSLDLAALQHALSAVIARHEPLRTVFSQQRGVPTGTVWPDAEIPLEHVSPDVGDVANVLVHRSGLSARTERPPLMAAYLARFAADHHVLTVVIHHLAADGFSLAILGREIATYYQRFVDGDPGVPLPATTFGHYVSAERQWLASPDAAECEQYWVDQLAGASPAIALPMDRPNPARPDFTAHNVVCLLTAEQTRDVAAAARAMKATPFMAVTAAFYSVLRDLTGTNDLVLGLDAANRSWPGSEELIGTFVNQLPLRLACPVAAPAFRDVLDVVRRQSLGAFAHERLPFHKIVAAVSPPRRAGRFPIFQVKLTQQGAWRAGLALPDIEVLPREFSEPETDLDLMLDISGESSRLRLELVYRPEVLDGETATAWVQAVGAVLRAGAADPDAALRPVAADRDRAAPTRAMSRTGRRW